MRRSTPRTAAAIEAAGDAKGLQRLLDPQVLVVVALNPEARVEVRRGPARAVLQQAGYTPVLVKVRQREHGDEAAPHQQPAGGAGVRRGGPAEHDAAESGRPEGEGKAAGKADRFLQVEMFASPPMTAEPQRPEGGICPGPALQQRGGPARGDARIRRRPGDPGPRLPRRGADPVRRPARHPRQARDPRPRRHADDRPVHVPRPRRARVSRRSPSGSPPTSSSRSRSTATTATWSCCRPAS